MRINTETMAVTADNSADLYKFKPGELFTLTPTTRIKWIALSNQNRGCVKAVRADSEFGKRTLAWVEAGKPDNEERQALRRDLGWSNPSLFYPSQLETAVKVVFAVGESRSEELSDDISK